MNSKKKMKSQNICKMLSKKTTQENPTNFKNVNPGGKIVPSRLLIRLWSCELQERVTQTVGMQHKPKKCERINQSIELMYHKNHN
jgi:hypothetical protein